MRNALDFGLGVAHGVKRFFGAGEVAIGGHAAATRLTEVNVTGQLADDQDVQARDQLGLEAGGTDQLLVADGGAEVGKQSQVLAQAQNGLLGTQRAVELVVFPVAHGTEQHRVGFLGQFEGGFGQGMAVCVVGGPADQGGLHLELQVEGVEDLDGLFDDFGADAVTGENCDFHVVGRACRRPPLRPISAD